MEDMYRVFILGGPESSPHESNLRDFPGAVIVTPEPVEPKFISGAWNYAVRKTSSGYLTVHYDKAIDFLREKHPDWIIIYPEKTRQVRFKADSVDLRYYTPPGD